MATPPALFDSAAEPGRPAESAFEGIWASSWASAISLTGVLVLIAALVLLFTGVYRLGLFNPRKGINRRVHRTMTYVALLTGHYPPFRLDQGPVDPPEAAADTSPARGTA